MRCFAMAKQHFQHAHVNQKGSMGNHKPSRKPRKPRFQHQWVAKTIEKTNKNKKTKISGPMGSQNHRENKTKQTTSKISGPMGSNNHRENQKTQKNKISGSMILVHDHWF